MPRFGKGGCVTKDLDLDRGLVVVRFGKGSKDRVAPLGAKSVGVLTRISHRPVRNAPEGPRSVANPASALKQTVLKA